MALQETDPREYSASIVDALLDMTATRQHASGALTHVAPGEMSIATPQQPPRVEQPDEVGPWALPGHCVPVRATARSLRILIVATEAPPVCGGIARTIGYLRDGFQKRGHHVDVLAYPQVGRLVFGRVRLSSLIFKLPQLLPRINTYDVIHIHGATPTISDVALLAHSRGRHPLIIYTHHMDMDFGPAGFLSRVYNQLHHQLSARADVVIASTMDNLKGLSDSCRGVVIPPGVDLEHFSTYGQKDPQFTVLFIGQFRPYKGVHVLLQAISQVPGVRLLLTGKGPEEQAYRSLAAELGLDVEFHIGVDDDQLRELYQRAHAVVLPSVSRLEAFGMVLAEGMAAGCVPIASDLPGVREVVGPTGFLFPAGDANGLAAILCDLRDDPALAQQISDYARIRAAEFGRERMLSAYERLITGLITCRDLKDRLADQAQSHASALHAFTTDVARDLEADWAEVVLRPSRDVLYPVASAGPVRLLDHRRFRQASSLLAWYAINMGSSTLVGPNDGPLHLRNVIACRMPAAIVTPLTVGGKHFGALLSMRERPFEQRDLSNLTCFARSAAPSLRMLVKHAMIGATR